MFISYFSHIYIKKKKTGKRMIGVFAQHGALNLQYLDNT